MKCVDCSYYWRDENEEYPRCHCGESWLDNPPCEEEDYYEDEDEGWDEFEPGRYNYDEMAANP